MATKPDSRISRAKIHRNLHGYYDMRRSVIITGPQACGKTRNSERMRKFFGMRRVLDDWNGVDDVPRYGVLILTNSDVVLGSAYMGCRFMRFDEVCSLMRLTSSENVEGDRR